MGKMSRAIGDTEAAPTDGSGAPNGGTLAERAARAADCSVRIPGVSSTDIIGQVGPARRWLFNTGIMNISNGTTATIRVRNPERNSDPRTLGLGQGTFVDWLAPWVDNPTEMYNKAITFRAVPPGADPSNPGTGLFYVFLDYDQEIVCWLPFGSDYGLRNPIERTPIGSGIFLSPCSRIDISLFYDSTTAVILPGATLV